MSFAKIVRAMRRATFLSAVAVQWWIGAPVWAFAPQSGPAPCRLEVSDTVPRVSSSMPLPDISGVQPEQERVCVGATALLNAPFIDPEAHYQWRKDGEDILGATGRVLIFPAVDVLDSGSYSVMISGPHCATVLARPAFLSVLPLPTIVMQPMPQQVCAGMNVLFSVVARGESLAYQWRRNGEEIRGATNASFEIHGAGEQDSGLYSVQVYGGDCRYQGAVSNEVALDVAPRVVIEERPARLTLREGEPMELNVLAHGQDLSYQWRWEGVAIEGATSPTYEVPAATPITSGTYDVLVTSPCGAILPSAYTIVSVEQIADVQKGDLLLPGPLQLDISPNPVRGIATIRGADLRIGSIADARLGFYDLGGALVLESAAMPDAEGMIRVDISRLADGIYYCCLLHRDNGPLCGRFVVCR